MADRCPLCGSLKCEMRSGENFTHFIKCKTFKASVHIEDDMIDRYTAAPEYPQLLNLIVEKLLREPTEKSGEEWVFYYNPEEQTPPDKKAAVNLATMMVGYPVSITDKVNRVLLNLAIRYPAYGFEFGIGPDELRLYFPISTDDSEDAYGIMQMLSDFGYVHKNGRSSNFRITAAGWKKVEELRMKSAETKQGFIAMSYREETVGIREAFRKAMLSAGYAACVIDEKEHNNQIVPEIFHEIRKSKFVVVDITYPNFGAYYEAGYAQGLGKEVIVCCKNDVFENKSGQYQRPHFDISQKSMVIWEDEEDLAKRLKRRIEATVQ